MKTGKGRRVEQWAVRLLCLIALVFVGFAHRPPLALPPASAAQALSLPDGSTPSLCSTGDHAHGGKTSDHKTASPSCEACRIGASVLLPLPPSCPSGHVAFARPTVLPPPDAPFRRQLYPPNRGPRAPPSGPIPA